MSTCSTGGFRAARALSFNDYVFDNLTEGVRQVLRTSGAEAVSVFGACIGGLLTVMWRPCSPAVISGCPILYATPVDCSAEHVGWFRWFTAPGVRAEWLVALFGNVPPEFVGSTPRPVKWIGDYLGIFLGRRNRLSQDPSLATWTALNQWVSEGSPFAGEAFRQMIHALVQRKLVKGEFQLRGRSVDLKNITCALLSMAGTQDVICRVPAG